MLIDEEGSIEDLRYQIERLDEIMLKDYNMNIQQNSLSSFEDAVNMPDESAAVYSPNNGQKKLHNNNRVLLQLLKNPTYDFKKRKPLDDLKKTLRIHKEKNNYSSLKNQSSKYDKS